jgi:ubiquitin C-terminal hydrolase
MSTICSAPQKPKSFIYHSNNINLGYNNHNYFERTDIKFPQKNVLKEKYPEDNYKSKNRVTRYINQRKRVQINKELIPQNRESRGNYNQPIKILQNSKVIEKSKQNQQINISKNSSAIPPIQGKPIYQYNRNYNQNLNNKTKNVVRNSSQAPNIKANLIYNNSNKLEEKPQHNISTIKLENSKIDMTPIYNINSKKEEEKVKINHRNESVFAKVTRSNFFVGNPEKKMKFQNGAIGLSNLGNTCYFNAAIQNLKNVYLLTLYLLKNYNSFNANEFAYKYCELIINLINQNIYQWYDPRKFFNKLAEKAPIFRFGEQSDSNFCVTYILSILEKETKIYLGEKPFKKIKIINNNYFNNDEIRIFNDFMNIFYEKRNSCITDIFYGFQEYIIKCNYCNYSKYTFQGFSVLNLSIIKSNYIHINSLSECIKYYMQVQNHINENGFCCPNCNGYNISTNTRIISLPKVLIINFKRIGEGNYYNHNVEILEELKIRNLVDNEFYEYTLIGFIKHYGDGYSGHNFAICKNFFDNKWYEYNDSKVSDIWNTFNIRENKIDYSGSFMFFYIKKNFNINENEKKLIINLANNFN